MRKILIPTDFSDNSYQIANYVTKLFKNENCEFYLFNAYTYGVTGLDAIDWLHTDDQWFKIPEKDSLKKLEKLLNYYKLKSNNVKHKFYGISQSTNVVDGIKENLEIKGADLLIITGGAGKKVGKTTQNILEKVRRTPVLIIRPPAFAFEKLYLTIVSDFKQKLNTIDLDNFCKVLENTNFDVKILVLETQNEITIQATNNLEALITYLKPFLKQDLTIEYRKASYDFKDNIASHHDGIICVVDEKPDLFRIVGLSKSNLISKLENSYSNPILVVHQ